jgi:hypothetical protein
MQVICVVGRLPYAAYRCHLLYAVTPVTQGSNPEAGGATSMSPPCAAAVTAFPPLYLASVVRFSVSFSYTSIYTRSSTSTLRSALSVTSVLVAAFSRNHQQQYASCGPTWERAACESIRSQSIENFKLCGLSPENCKPVTILVNRINRRQISSYLNASQMHPRAQRLSWKEARSNNCHSPPYKVHLCIVRVISFRRRT